MLGNPLVACHSCGRVHRAPQIPPGATARCSRCGDILFRHRRNSIDNTLALAVAGLFLFVVANSFPFLGFQMQGLSTQTTLFTGVRVLYAENMGALALAVFFTAILAPGLRIALLLYLLLPIRLGAVPPGFARLFRWDMSLVSWEMMDVFMLGILVAVVKLNDMATIVPGLALWAFMALIFVLAAAQANLTPRLLWERVSVKGAQSLIDGADTVHCHACGLVLPAEWDDGHCPRCAAHLHRRKPASIQRTWALVIAALICYIPANLLPVMTVTSLGKTQSDTILSGAQYLLLHGMWPLALIVFVASVLVPMLKLAILVFLLLSVQSHSNWRLRDRTRLYHITEFVGRWSMVDIYVVTILVALVQLGNLATIEAGLGAVFFAAVVVLTMFAAMTFDPRLIWDAVEPQHDETG